MNIAVLTTMNEKLHNKYGYKFLHTYKWPFDLIVYSEDMYKGIYKDIKIINIFEKVPQCKEFIQRNKFRKIENEPYNFLFDGVRFSYKVYSYTDMIINSKDYDGLIFIDADSIFYKSIDSEWIKSFIHKDDCMTSYLGRGEQYTETGFIYFNLKHSKIFDFAKSMQDMYNRDKIYDLVEYHDCICFDHIRKKFENDFNIKNFNLGDGKPGHVQSRSILGNIYDHIKGDEAKKNFVSLERKSIKTIFIRIIRHIIKVFNYLKIIFLKE